MSPTWVDRIRRAPIEVGPPALEDARIAKFSRDLGVKLLGLSAVELRWFRPSDSDHQHSVQGKAIDGVVWVKRATHAPEHLCEIVLHELKHVELDAGFNSTTRERICLEFGAKWARSVYAAGRVTDFDAARVTLIRASHPDHVHPTLKARRGDVALSRESGRVWERRDVWREVLA